MRSSNPEETAFRRQPYGSGRKCALSSFIIWDQVAKVFEVRD